MYKCLTKSSNLFYWANITDEWWTILPHNARGSDLLNGLNRITMLFHLKLELIIIFTLLVAVKVLTRQQQTRRSLISKQILIKFYGLRKVWNISPPYWVCAYWIFITRYGYRRPALYSLSFFIRDDINKTIYSIIFPMGGDELFIVLSIVLNANFT